MDESDKAPCQRVTTAAQRFGGFAAAHILYSLVCLVPLYLLAIKLEVGLVGLGFMWQILPFVLVLLYFPLGMLTAWLAKWAYPQTDKEKRQAVFHPVIVAWLWVCIVLVCIIGEWEKGFEAVILFSFLLASPSSFFVISTMGSLFWWTGGGGLLQTLAVGGILAGFFPPLLFALGSFWQSGRMEGRGETRDG